MLRITENKDEIVISETPVAAWISSLIVAIILFAITYSWLSSAAVSSNLAFSLAIIVAVAALVIFNVINPSITTKINRQGQIISVRKQSLIKYNFNVYSFNEVADLIYVDETKNSRSNKTYQLIMPLKDGSKIELSNTVNAKEGQYFNAAQLINSYVFYSPDQIPVKFAVFIDD